MEPGLIAQKLGGARVGLRRDLDVSRHMVAGEPSYVFHDPVAFRSHAFTADEYKVMTAIRADRNLSDVFEGLGGPNSTVLFRNNYYDTTMCQKCLHLGASPSYKS